jgi:glyoxylase-like metal-dependent hydrolase (beta-lactamase superfamily II)
VKRLLTAWEQNVGRKIPLLAHAKDRSLRSSIVEQARMFGVAPGEFENCPEPDRFIDEGDIVEIGALKTTVLFVPGHAPGHVALYFERQEIEVTDYQGETRQLSAPVAIVGDVLFSGSVGRTDLPEGNHELLLQSIREKLLPLPDDTLVASGHGPDTTIGRERRTNPFLVG